MLRAAQCNATEYRQLRRWTVDPQAGHGLRLPGPDGGKGRPFHSTIEFVMPHIGA
jgi:hypothetical protein